MKKILLLSLCAISYNTAWTSEEANASSTSSQSLTHVALASDTPTIFSIVAEICHSSHQVHIKSNTGDEINLKDHFIIKKISSAVITPGGPAAPANSLLEALDTFNRSSLIDSLKLSNGQKSFTVTVKDADVKLVSFADHELAPKK